MSKQPPSKLTQTMLTQLQQNEYLRVKLIQLQKASRQKDNFYLSIFRQQQKMTQKVMSQLLLAEQKIKEFVRQRICNNWKDEYDNLAENITSYVNDVNGLIEEYQQTKKQLQEKAYKTNDLYDYYSNTLEECGKKFDQAQIIIEQLNSNIENLKQTVINLDEELQEKISIIEDQKCEIYALKEELNDQSELEFLRETHQTDTKTNQTLKKAIRKLEKDNQALERSNLELGRLVNELRKQQDDDKLKKEMLQQDLFKLEKSIEELTNKMNHQKQDLKSEETQKRATKGRIFKKNDIKQVGMFDSNNNPVVPQPTKSEEQQKLLSQNQLHLRKILQQQQTINNLTLQLSYNKKSIQNLESQNKKLIQYQIQYINMENSYKRQFSQMKQKILDLNQQLQLRNQQITGLQMERMETTQQGQNVMIQVQGLHEEIANKELQIKRLNSQITQLQKKLEINKKQNDFLLKANQEYQENIEILQKQKQDSKQYFQNLLEEFQQFVKESQYEKQLEIQQRKQSLSLCSLQFNEIFFIQKNKVIQTPTSNEYSKMKKKNLLLNFGEKQTLNQNEELKQFNTQSQIPPRQINPIKAKKFNLQTFQQKTNPQINICWSPKVGEIYNAVHQGRIPVTHRW